jgi:hypothetical protein
MRVIFESIPVAFGGYGSSGRFHSLYEEAIRLSVTMKEGQGIVKGDALSLLGIVVVYGHVRSRQLLFPKNAHIVMGTRRRAMLRMNSCGA